MRTIKNINPEKDLENKNNQNERQHLTSFQAELASMISDAALKSFKDLMAMNDDQAKRFGRIISNYASNLTSAMDRLAVDTRIH